MIEAMENWNIGTNVPQSWWSFTFGGNVSAGTSNVFFKLLQKNLNCVTLLKKFWSWLRHATSDPYEEVSTG